MVMEFRQFDRELFYNNLANTCSLFVNYFKQNIRNQNAVIQLLHKIKKFNKTV